MDRWLFFPGYDKLFLIFIAIKGPYLYSPFT
jgi:hypothetical protein